MEASVDERYRRGKLCTAWRGDGAICLMPVSDPDFRKWPWPLCDRHVRQLDEAAERKFDDRWRKKLKEIQRGVTGSHVVYFVQRADGLAERHGTDWERHMRRAA